MEASIYSALNNFANSLESYLEWTSAQILANEVHPESSMESIKIYLDWFNDIPISPSSPEELVFVEELAQYPQLLAAYDMAKILDFVLVIYDNEGNIPSDDANARNSYLKIYEMVMLDQTWDLIDYLMDGQFKSIKRFGLDLTDFDNDAEKIPQLKFLETYNSTVQSLAINLTGIHGGISSALHPQINTPNKILLMED